jgi:hypothetical protein
VSSRRCHTNLVTGDKLRSNVTGCKKSEPSQALASRTERLMEKIARLRQEMQRLERAMLWDLLSDILQPIV